MAFGKSGGMARQLRHHYAGGWCHITARDMGRREIFADDLGGERRKKDDDCPMSQYNPHFAAERGLREDGQECPSPFLAGGASVGIDACLSTARRPGCVPAPGQVGRCVAAVFVM